MCPISPVVPFENGWTSRNSRVGRAIRRSPLSAPVCEGMTRVDVIVGTNMHVSMGYVGSARSLGFELSTADRVMEKSVMRRTHPRTLLYPLGKGTTRRVPFV